MAHVSIFTSFLSHHVYITALKIKIRFMFILLIYVNVALHSHGMCVGGRCMHSALDAVDIYGSSLCVCKVVNVWV